MKRISLTSSILKSLVSTRLLEFELDNKLILVEAIRSIGLVEYPPTTIFYELKEVDGAVEAQEIKNKYEYFGEDLIRIEDRIDRVMTDDLIR